MIRVALVVMPFVSSRGPLLGVSQLVSVLKERGYDATVKYPALSFAAAIGLSRYERIAERAESLVGEWIFARTAFPNRCFDLEDEVYLGEIVPRYGYDEEEIAELGRIRSEAGVWLDQLAAQPIWETFDVIGFTSSFQQTTASIALAVRLKRRLPRLRIFFGGANCEAEMGETLLEICPYLDGVCSGEGEVSFPKMIENTIEARQGWNKRNNTEKPKEEKTLSGKEGRGESGFVDLDALPFPDFGHYYGALREELPGIDPRQTFLKFEYGRGCSWGSHSHCTFCGLNGASMVYRHKSPERAVEELVSLEQYPARSVLVADNLLDRRAIREFLPRVEKASLRLRFFFEVKATLRKEEMAALRRAGVRRVQPGIESFSTEILRGMRKGSRGIDAVGFLKNALRENLAVTWNMLCGFPHEPLTEYEEMIELLEAVRHLPPPVGLFPVRIHRFSPFFREPERFGWGRIRPLRQYAAVFPFSEEVLERLAYFFEPDFAPESLASPQRRKTREIAKRMRDAIERWKIEAAHGGSVLFGIPEKRDGEEKITIWDRRFGRGGEEEQGEEITGLEAKILIMADEPIHQQRLEERLRGEGWRSEEIAKALARLSSRQWLLLRDGSCLSLVMDWQGGKVEEAPVAEAIFRARLKALTGEGIQGT